MRLFDYVLSVTRWDRKAPLLDFAHWDFGMEKWNNEYNTTQLWLGPLHICLEKLPRPTP